MRHRILLCLIITLASCNLKTANEYLVEAVALEKESKYEKAILLLDKALEKDPDNIYALLNRAADKSMLKNYSGAIEDYSKVIELDPDNTLAYFNRGLNFKRLQDYSRAYSNINKAIDCKGGEYITFSPVQNDFVETGYQFDVSIEELRLTRGIISYHNNLPNQVLKDMDYCIRQNFESAEAYHWRGLAYMKLKMSDNACQDWMKCKSLESNQSDSLLNLHCNSK